MFWFRMVLCRGSTPLRHLHVCHLRHAAHASCSSPESRTRAHLSTASQNLHLSTSQHCDATMHTVHEYNKASAASRCMSMSHLGQKTSRATAQGAQRVLYARDRASARVLCRGEAVEKHGAGARQHATRKDLRVYPSAPR